MPKPIEPTCTCSCATCDSVEMSQEELKTHLETIHGLTFPAPCRRELTTHLDCSDSYHSFYVITFGQVKVHQAISMPRKKTPSPGKP